MHEYPIITINMTGYGGIYLTTCSERYKTFKLVDTEGERGSGGEGALNPS